MWTREQLKANAKSSLSRFHWTAVLVCLIVVLLGGAGSSGLNFNLDLNDGSSWIRWAIPTFAAIGATSTLVGILVGNVAAVGSARFFLIGRERIPTTEIMFDPFRANYGGMRNSAGDVPAGPVYGAVVAAAGGAGDCERLRVAAGAVSAG